MSEIPSSRIKGIKSTDFSIARILTNNNQSKYTLNLQSPTRNLELSAVRSQQNPEEDTEIPHKVITRQHDFSVQPLNHQEKVPKYEQEKYLIEKYVSCCITPHKMCQDTSVISEDNHDNDNESVRRMRTSDLTWLQYTRYRPPKLPRKSFIKNRTKRRVGDHPRIPFSSTQLQILENKYKRDPYLSRSDGIEMSRILCLPQNKVKIWFQNRRARQRRELLNSAIVTR